MTFVDGFFSFNLEISNADRGLYLRTRVKTPKHPYETMEHLMARVLAFAHSYEEGLEFSRGLFAPEEPTIWKRDLLGEVKLWVQLGAPEGEKFERSLRRSRSARRVIYFQAPEQLAAFGRSVQRCRTNWSENLTCYALDEEVPVRLAKDARSSSDWQLTVIDELVSVVANGSDIQTTLAPLDMAAVIAR